jgi:hypothetical protein
MIDRLLACAAATVMLCLSWNEPANALVVSGTTDATTLRDALIGTNVGGLGDGIQITGFTVDTFQSDAGALSTGTYTNDPTAPLGSDNAYNLPEQGIVLSTGDVADYGPGIRDNNSQISTDYGTGASVAQDTLLNEVTDALISGSAPNDLEFFDVTQIDIAFDLLPTFDEISLTMLFGTEEYPLNYSPTDPLLGINDAFGVFVDGVNIALVDGQTVTANTETMLSVSQPPTQTPLSGILHNQAAEILLNLSTSLAAGGHTLTIILGDEFDGATDSTVYLSQFRGLGGTGPTPAPIPPSLALCAVGLVGLARMVHMRRIKLGSDRDKA